MEFLLLHHAVGFSGFCVMISRGNEKAWERLRSEQKIKKPPKIAFVFCRGALLMLVKLKSIMWFGHLWTQSRPQEPFPVKVSHCFPIPVTPEFLVERIATLTERRKNNCTTASRILGNDG
jgi:hypothetical protein